MKIALLTAAFALLITRTALADLGWTEAQMKAKYGKGEVSDSQIATARAKLGLKEVTYRLPKAKFADLHKLGVTDVAVEFLDGKVATLRFLTSTTWEKKSVISYEHAKRAALAFIEDAPNPAAISEESKPAAGSKTPQGSFHYQAWRVTWEPQEVSIGPVPGSAAQQRIAAIVAQTS